MVDILAQASSNLTNFSCQSGGHGRLDYLPCLSYASRDPIFLKIVTHETASCSSMSFRTHQKLGMVDQKIGFKRILINKYQAEKYISLKLNDSNLFKEKWKMLKGISFGQ